ncbi:MAG: 16S rRNA (guanine(527)-N(7))-methyltransferase RsmG [Clostridiales bacterium]|nr:16S rRNA (guanine(527)-N(7))-methyltransferase RsmG [Clostridiales bacterium]
MERIRRALAELNTECTDRMLEQFQVYMDGVLEWNEKLNLTAITDRDEFIEKHFVDSLMAVDSDEVRKAESVIDVGTGAGFPGIPLAIVFPEKKFVLMDSLNKRLKVIDDLCERAGIMNVVTAHGRAEELSRNKLHREKYDLCIARAVANMSTLSEYCLPFIGIGGYFLAYKGPDCEEELNEAKNAIKILGGKIEDVREAEISDFGLSHKIVYVKKIKETPAKYPRKAGTPSKDPLK